MSPIRFLSKTPPPRRSFPTNVLKKPEAPQRGEARFLSDHSPRDTPSDHDRHTRVCRGRPRALPTRVSEERAGASSARAAASDERAGAARRRCRRTEPPTRTTPTPSPARSPRAFVPCGGAASARSRRCAPPRARAIGRVAAAATPRTRAPSSGAAPASRREARRPRRLGAPATPPRTPRTREASVLCRPARAGAARRGRETVSGIRRVSSEPRVPWVMARWCFRSSRRPTRDASLFRPAEAAAAKRQTPDARAVPKRARRIASSPPAGAGARACPSRVAHARRSRRYRRRAKTRPRHRRVVSLRRAANAPSRARPRYPPAAPGAWHAVWTATPSARRRSSRAGPGTRTHARARSSRRTGTRESSRRWLCLRVFCFGCVWVAVARGVRYAVRGVERVLETRATCSAFVSVVTLDADEKAGRCGRGGRGVRGRGRGARAGRTFRAPERRRRAAGGAGGVPGAHPRRVACPEVFDSNEGCADSRSLLA